MSVTWTNELELILLEYYQGEPILWQAKNSNHKNKSKVYDAWKRISESMNISIPEIKKKKDSLLSSYRVYRKKVRDSIHSGAGSGEIYKPVWFAYETIESFLGERNKCNKAIDTVRRSSSEANIEAPDELSLDTPKCFLVLNSNDPLDINKKSIKRKRLAEEDLSPQRIDKRTTAVYSTSNEDEFYYFGQSVAAQLRALPVVNALDMQAKIQTLLSTERRKMYQE